MARVSEFINQAANLKCRRSIAFPNCFVLAMGEAIRCPTLFARKETELTREMKKEPFRTEIIFLDELARREAKPSGKLMSADYARRKLGL